MGNESDTNTKTKTSVTKDNSSNYITFEKVQKDLQRIMKMVQSK